jgi:dUTP pyrophosphatase
VFSFLVLYTTQDNQAQQPTRGSVNAAGYDLTSVDFARIQPGERVLINTGLSLAIPEGYFGNICPRSGLALNHGICVGGGIIDSDYRGQIKVLLINSDRQRDFLVEPGTKIAQLIFIKHGIFNFVRAQTLPLTDRGCKGFGSSGM